MTTYQQEQEKLLATYRTMSAAGFEPKLIWNTANDDIRCAFCAAHHNQVTTPDVIPPTGCTNPDGCRCTLGMRVFS